jgi:hypothetical protein
MNTLRKIAACVATWLIAAHPALALNDTIGVTAGSGKTANLIAFGGGTVISEVGICDATTVNQCAAVGAGGALLVTGTGGTFPVTGTVAVSNITGTVSLPTGAANAVAQGSTTAGQTGNLIQGAVTFASPTYTNAQTSPLSLDTGGNLRVNIVSANLSGLALETGGNLAAIKTDTDRLLSSATNITAGSALATTSFVIGTRYLSTPPTFTNGQEGAFQIDAAGRMLVSGTGTGATGAAVPAGAQYVGMSQGGNLTGLTGTSGNLNVQCANCSGSGVSTVDAATFTATTSLFAGSGGFFQTTATNNALTTGQQGMFQVTANRALFSNLRNAAGAEVGTAGVPLQVSLANTAANGTAVTVASTLNAETTKVIGTVRNLGNTGAVTDFAGQNAASPANSWLMGAQFNTTPTTLTTGNASPLQMDSAGNLLVNIKAGAGSGGTALADKSAWTVSSTNLTPIGGEFTTGGATACATGQACTVAITAARELMVSATGLAAASTTSGQTGSMVMGAVSTSPPAYTTAQTNYVSLTTAGAVRTNLVADPTGGCTPTHTLSAATTNSTNIKNAAGTLCSVTIINNTATAADFRLYNLSAAPTCSSATGVVANYGVQANTTSPGLSPNLGTYGLNFDTGIGFCLTNYDPANIDTANSASVTGIQINLAYK